MNVVPLGFDPGALVNVAKEAEKPSVGYFCRVSSMNGFDKLVDAFITIRNENLVPGLTLHVSGGYTGDDKPFISEQIKKIKAGRIKKSCKNIP